MSEPVLAQKDPSVVLSEALATYESETGVSLAPADPRRLHLQALLLFLAQIRQLIDFSGKQSMLRYVASTWIDALADLWGEPRLPAQPSTCTVRFNFSVAGVHQVEAGKRVTDGTSMWAIVTATDNSGSGSGPTYIQTTVQCTTNGAASNGVAIGQIDTLVDSIPGCSSVANVDETAGGRDLEDVEAFRTRLRSVPESSSAAGPRVAYEALALNASASVEDAVCLAQADAGDLALLAPGPGQVLILIMEVGAATPSAGLITTVQNACRASDKRPLADEVLVYPPSFVDYDLVVSYWIARSRLASAVEIQEAVEAAFTAYEDWQRKIGRDLNPSELTARLMAAGAKRVEVTSPTFAALAPDQCSRLNYEALVYGGIESD